MREAGVEVILGGFAQPEEIVETAIQEDVELIGYRIMDREPVVLVSKLCELLGRRAQRSMRLIVGGIVAHGDIRRLRELGVEAVFRPGSSLDEIVSQVVNGAPEKS